MTEVGNQSAPSLCLCLCLFFQICARCRRCLRFPIPFPTCLAVLLFRTFNKEREKESFIEIKKSPAYSIRRITRCAREEFHAQSECVCVRKNARRMQRLRMEIIRVPFLRDFKYSFLFLSLSLSVSLFGFFFTTPSLSATHSSE